MDTNILSSMEIDTIGEVVNISLGAAATTVSMMLDARVDITTPIVSIKTKSEFEFKNLDPAVGVEINNCEGLTGKNVMLLKRNDVRIILGMLMGMEVSEEEFEMDEIAMSAIGEVMNQMMGASATALSELLGRSINITTPITFEITDVEAFKDKYFQSEEIVVEVKFNLQIGDQVETEFVYLIPIELAKEIVEGFFKDQGMEFLAEASAPDPVVVEPTPVVEMPAVAAPVVETPVAVQAPVVTPPPMVEASPVQATNPVPMGTPMANDQMTNTMAQMMELMRQQMEMTQLQMAQLANRPAAEVQNRKIKSDAIHTPNLQQSNVATGTDTNLDLVMNVPVEVSVEIGRTKKLVKDVLDLSKGSLVVLDKLAGEQVDLYVNGQFIAKGDVVVVDDSFAVRITEIVDKDFAFVE